ncbi:MAG TPA: 30S ribosomal protein S16 [Anaerolineaceae bacterium]|jgi:small subunit ribosomal protein S16|nr:30S ribosomal protein S16 [Anaerolineaceae bacterium]
MVRIRLRRVGSAHQAHYRVVVADKESPRDGRFIEIVGHYNPRTKPGTIEFKEDRIFYWLGVGAQPSETVEKLFKQVGLDERFKRYKAGEDVEALLAEAEETYKNRVTNTRTTHND